MLRSTAVLIALLFLTSCGPCDCETSQQIVPMQDLAPTDTELSRAYLIGTWYLDQARSDGSTVRSKAILADDGLVEIEFLVHYADGTTFSSREFGYWGVSGDVYFTIIREASDGNERYQVSSFDASYYLAYRILDLSDELFRYQTIVTDNVFESRKVPDGFAIPNANPARPTD